MRWAYREYQSKIAKEQAAIEDYERRVRIQEQLVIREQIEQQSVLVREPVRGGGVITRWRIVDPLLDQPDLTGLDVETLEVYLEADARLLNRDNEQGLTLAHRAAQLGRADLLEYLIEHNAVTTKQADGGITPLHLLALTWPESQDRDSLLACARLLLENKSDPNQQADDLRSPTELAAEHADGRLLNLLQEFGGKPPFGPFLR